MFMETHENEMPAVFKHVRGSTNGVQVGNEIWFLCHVVAVNDKRISKHYLTYNALNKDNGVEAFYDKDKDDTPYMILKLYLSQRKSMEPDEFLTFLTEVLISKHNTPDDEARNLAETLIRGKKKVEEGALASVNQEHARIENNKICLLLNKELCDIHKCNRVGW
jgi:hypothetical protein